MTPSLRVVTINKNENHSSYKDSILRWCDGHNIDIFYVGRTIDNNYNRYVWGIDCSEEQMLLFMIAWAAEIVGKIKRRSK